MWMEGNQEGDSLEQGFRYRSYIATFKEVRIVAKYSRTGVYGLDGFIFQCQNQSMTLVFSLWVQGHIASALESASMIPFDFPVTNE